MHDLPELLLWSAGAAVGCFGVVGLAFNGAVQLHHATRANPLHHATRLTPIGTALPADTIRLRALHRNKAAIIAPDMAGLPCFIAENDAYMAARRNAAQDSADVATTPCGAPLLQ